MEGHERRKDTVVVHHAKIVAEATGYYNDISPSLGEAHEQTPFVILFGRRHPAWTQLLDSLFRTARCPGTAHAVTSRKLLQRKLGRGVRFARHAAQFRFESGRRQRLSIRRAGPITPGFKTRKSEERTALLSLFSSPNSSHQ
jgi:hypothetical protein